MRRPRPRPRRPFGWKRHPPGRLSGRPWRRYGLPLTRAWRFWTTLCNFCVSVLLIGMKASQDKKSDERRNLLLDTDELTGAIRPACGCNSPCAAICVSSATEMQRYLPVEKSVVLGEKIKQ